MFLPYQIVAHPDDGPFANINRAFTDTSNFVAYFLKGGADDLSEQSRAHKTSIDSAYTAAPARARNEFGIELPLTMDALPSSRPFGPR
jgi:hypothetical protein